MSENISKTTIDILTHLAIFVTFMLAGLCTLIALSWFGVMLSYNPRAGLETAGILLSSLIILIPPSLLIALNSKWACGKTKLKFLFVTVIVASAIALILFTQRLLEQDPGDKEIYLPVIVLGYFILATTVIVLGKIYYFQRKNL